MRSMDYQKSWGQWLTLHRSETREYEVLAPKLKGSIADLVGV